MNSNTLRKLWSVIEQTQTPVLLELDDTDLVRQLMHQLQNTYVLSGEEKQAAHHYLKNRLWLIRDLAQA